MAEVKRLRGRPPAGETRRNRARFLARAADARLVVCAASGFSLERTMDELGLSPRLVIRMLDDPSFPAALRALRAAAVDARAA